MKREKRANARKDKVRTETSEFQRRLAAYCLSASAAGVAALACSLNAEAAPICKSPSISLFQQSVPVNPAGLRVAPFELADTFNNVSSETGAAGNRGFFTPNAPLASALLAANGFPADLPSGASIGPGGSFGKGREYGLLFTYTSFYGNRKKHHRGNFQFGQDNYFGFKFAISGQTHYGWLRLEVSFGPGLDGVATTIHLREYAYESNPNTAILAGSCSQSDSPAVGTDLRGNASDQAATSSAKSRATPASLGVLASGASGLSLWRR